MTQHHDSLLSWLLQWLSPVTHPVTHSLHCLHNRLFFLLLFLSFLFSFFLLPSFFSDEHRETWGIEREMLRERETERGSWTRRTPKPRDPEPEPMTRIPERKTRFFLCVFRRLFWRNQWLFRWICYENPWGKFLQPMIVYFVDWLDYCEIRVLWFWGFSMDWLGYFID
jgi:hypothetical protein